MKLLSLFCLIGFSVSAQNLAVLTHQAANSPEYQKGCPGGWPAQVRDIGALEVQELPWVVMTKKQYEALRESLGPAKEAWNKAQEEAPKLAKAQEEAAKKAEADATVSEIEVGLKEWQSADEKRKGEVLLKLLYMIVEALRNLGADVKQVEKPTSEIAIGK